MRHWKSRLVAFLICFGIGLTLSLIVSFVARFFRDRHQNAAGNVPLVRHTCGAADSFASPEEVLAALKSEDVLVRREVWRRLFLRPGVATTYYDYERDRDYPERAERTFVKYVNLDEQPNDEAVLTFVRHENPVALVLKKDDCGWWPVGALSAWLRFEDYPYEDWLEMAELDAPCTHAILLHESTGDATEYARNVRLLKLTDGALVEVAQFSEESIKPLEGYREADWSDVKLREVTRYTLTPASSVERARLRLVTEEEVIKYSGVPAAYTFWTETDGAWHTARKPWRERPSDRLKLLDTRTRELTWDDARQRFVEEM
jgi:hypothetical protein